MRASKSRLAIAFAVLAGCHSKTSATPDAGPPIPAPPVSTVSPLQAAMDMMTAAGSSTAGAPTPDEAAASKTPDDFAQMLARSLVDGGAPAHPFFIGPFGPSPLTVFGIAQTDPTSPFTVVAAKANPVSHGPMPYDAVPIEPLTDTPWNGWAIDAILFDAIDKAKNPSPIVIAEFMTGIGPDGAKPFTEVIVYRWNGAKFVHAKTVEKKLAGATTAEEVRKRLEPLKKGE